jgi:hypothetical protein
MPFPVQEVGMLYMDVFFAPFHSQKRLDTYTYRSAVQVQSAVRGVMPTISKCIFVGNHAKRNGGAVDITSVTGDLVIEFSVLEGNTACAGGGAAAFTSTARVLVRGCTFANNSVIVRGCDNFAPRAWSKGVGGALFHVRSPGNCCTSAELTLSHATWIECCHAATYPCV